MLRQASYKGFLKPFPSDFSKMVADYFKFATLFLFIPYTLLEPISGLHEYQAFACN